MGGHLCRGVLGSHTCERLLKEYHLDNSVTPGVLIESSIRDPAFARQPREVEMEHFFWNKTWEQLDEERRNFDVAPFLSENVAPGTTPFAPVSNGSNSTALEENGSFFTTEQLLQLQQVSRRRVLPREEDDEELENRSDFVAEPQWFTRD